jgi:signal transduction histidine kinase
MKLIKQELRERIIWLIRLRLGFILVFAFFILFWGGIRWPPEITPFLYIFLWVCSYELAFIFYTWKRKIEQRNASILANAQILLDFFALTALAYFTGGIFSPLTFFFVFHVITASILLSKRNSLMVSMLAVLLYLVLGVLTFSYPPAYTSSVVRLMTDNLFWGLGIPIAFVSMIFYAWFTATALGERLRERMTEIMTLRELLEEKASELNMAYRILLESEQTKARYMRRISHELKNPLATISMLVLSTLKDKGSRLSEDSRRALNKALNKIDEAVILLSDILTLAKAREIGVIGRPMKVKVEPFLKELVEPYRKSAEDKGLKFILESALKEDEVELDPEGFRIVMDNLLSNAVKYTTKGEVGVKVWDDDEGLYVKVWDTGIGMSAEELGRLFEEFYRSAEARKMEKGTGLGLSIVKSVLDRWGGEIEVKSEKGKGTTVMVKISKKGSNK